MKWNNIFVLWLIDNCFTERWRVGCVQRDLPARVQGRPHQLHLPRQEFRRTGQIAAALCPHNLDFLQGWATALLSGLPGAPVISSGELSASLTSYQLAWHTTSITDIAEYNILYRKLPVCPNTIVAVAK